MAHSFAYLRPTSTRAPSGPIDSSWGCSRRRGRHTGRDKSSLIVLGDDESASENEAPDRERMPVLSLCRPRLQVLGFYFRVPVSSKLCLEVDLIHLNSPSLFWRASRLGPSAVG